MPYITSVERIGYKRGIQDGEKRGEKTGKKVGLKEGQVELLARQIARKFKSKISSETPLLNELNLRDLRTLGEKILVLTSLDEVHAWIQQRITSE